MNRETNRCDTQAWRVVVAALAAGASVAEIMEVLKLCVAHGVAASNLGVAILAEELTGREGAL